MKTLRIILLLCLVLSFKSLASEKNLLFSDFEWKVWSIVMNDNGLPPETIKIHLKQLEQLALNDQQKDLLLIHLCRINSLLKDTYDVTLKKTITISPTNVLEQRAAYYRCKLEEAKARKLHYQKVELSHLTYRNLTNHDLPSLVMWISYDYIETAMDAALYDDALNAITTSLNIAEKNGLTDWKAETLGKLALLESALEEYTKALNTNQQAISLVNNPEIKFELNANRAYILAKAGQLIEARTIYERQLQQYHNLDEVKFLISGINLAGIYFALEEYEKNYSLITELMPLARAYPDSYLLAYLTISYADTLLSLNKFEEAKQAFSEATLWFKHNQSLEPLARFLNDWSVHLFYKEHYLEAYKALSESVELNKSIALAKRKENSLLSLALLDANHKTIELATTKRLQEEQQEKLILKQLEQRFVLTLLVATFLIGFLVVFINRRLKSVNRLLVEKNKNLDYASKHDPLTGLYNRRYLYSYITKVLIKKRAFMLLLIDIDHFKSINDRFGHDIGDLVLKELASCLKSSLRETECIVRWGGEEFLVFIESPPKSDSCIQLVQRLLADIANYNIEFNNRKINITASIGFSIVEIALQTEFESSVSELDTFLYKAKDNGRNCAYGKLLDNNEIIKVTAYTQANNASVTIL